MPRVALNDCGNGKLLFWMNGWEAHLRKRDARTVKCLMGRFDLLT